VTAVVGKLTAEVRYLSSKNRESQLSCCFKRYSDIVGRDKKIVSTHYMALIPGLNNNFD
jgi:hypothetical protein